MTIIARCRYIEDIFSTINVFRQLIEFAGWSHVVVERLTDADPNEHCPILYFDETLDEDGYS